MLQAFSFVSPEDVVECYNTLYESTPLELATLHDCDYWADNYIDRIRSNRRANPFDIALWNMHGRVVDGLPRTNYSVEVSASRISSK